MAAQSSLRAWGGLVASGPAGERLYKLPYLEPEWRPPVELVSQASLTKFRGEMQSAGSVQYFSSKIHEIPVGFDV